MARWNSGDSSSSIPDWFFQAVETEYALRTVEVDGCDVAYQVWGDTGNPGLLFIHGMNAHAHWWDFIAPQFLDRYQVVAMNLCGMGDSDYRYEYHGATFAEEIKAVCDDCEFDDDVTVIAHSFGGNMAVKAANLFPERFGALILVDSGIRHPDEPYPDRPSMGGGRGKVYPDRETALGRFRVQPPQPCENSYILEYIARNSLMSVDGGGWTWKFDEDLLTSMFDVERTPEDYQSLRVPLGIIYGADSELFTSRSEQYMRELVPQEFPAVAIAEAQHHLFLDQPEVFVKALGQMLAELAPRG